MMGISEELMDRAKTIAREMTIIGRHSMPIDLLGQKNEKNSGVVTDSKEGIIVIGSFEQEGVRFYIGLTSE